MPDDKTPYSAIHDDPIQDDAVSHNPMHREKRNVYINGKRTSLSIEAYIWAEIDHLSASESITIALKLGNCRSCHTLEHKQISRGGDEYLRVNPSSERWVT